MKKVSLTVLMIFGMQALLVGCALGPDPVLLQKIDNFSVGAISLASAVNKRYDMAENAHRSALQSNLNLQLELGGSPEVTAPDLFSPDVRASRYAILRAIQIYAGNLQQVYDSEIKNNYQNAHVAEIPFAALKSLNPKDFDLKRSLGDLQVENLVTSLSGFSKLLFYPKRDRKVSEILATAHPFIEKAAILLYLDLGAPKDLHEKCAFAPASTVKTGNVIDLQLCRGGVRGMMKTAISSSLQTWNLRLQLNSLNSSASAERAQIVRKIYDVEQAGSQQDHLMQNLQGALIEMVSAHLLLVEEFAGDAGKGSSKAKITPPLLLSSPQNAEGQKIPGSDATSPNVSVQEFTIQVKSLSDQSESFDKFFENSDQETNS